MTRTISTQTGHWWRQTDLTWSSLGHSGSYFSKIRHRYRSSFLQHHFDLCYQVMKMKGLRICSDHFSIVVLNNVAGRCIKNASLTIRQGDKFSIEMFTYGMDPVLVYLEKCLQGIPILQLPVQGPVQCTVSSASPSTT